MQDKLGFQPRSFGKLGKGKSGANRSFGLAGLSGHGGPNPEEWMRDLGSVSGSALDDDVEHDLENGVEEFYLPDGDPYNVMNLPNVLSNEFADYSAPTLSTPSVVDSNAFANRLAANLMMSPPFSHVTMELDWYWIEWVVVKP